MSSRSIITLALENELKNALFKVGFKYKEDLINFNAETLHKILDEIPISDCNEILNVCFFNGGPEKKTLREVLRDEFKDRKIQKIKTSCKSLDRKLNGGIPVGNVVELYGGGGSGKTQFCYQLCLNVQLPVSMKGLDAEVLYIDTESRFKTERISEIAQHLSRNVLNQEEFNENQFLDRIHLVRVSRSDKLRMLIIYHIERFLSDHPRVKLVILDSVSYQMRFHRHDVEMDYRLRTKEIHLIAHQLRMIAHKCSVAVVITNQVTRNLETEQLQPALGKTWSFTCSTKLFLERLDDDVGTRRITLVKSRLKGPFTSLFQIQVRNSIL